MFSKTELRTKVSLELYLHSMLDNNLLYNDLLLVAGL